MEHKFANLNEGLLEVHYQDLDNFDIDVLITEEIHLNFPLIVHCCGPYNNDDLNDEDIEKIQPFKKIRDLIE